MSPLAPKLPNKMPHPRQKQPSPSPNQHFFCGALHGIGNAVKQPAMPNCLVRIGVGDGVGDGAGDGNGNGFGGFQLSIGRSIRSGGHHGHASCFKCATIGQKRIWFSWFWVFFMYFLLFFCLFTQVRVILSISIFFVGT